MKSFAIFEEKIKERGVNARVAVVNPVIKTAIESVFEANKKGFVDPILIGPKEQIESIIKKENLDFHYTIIDVESDIEAVKKAVEMIKNNEADVILKGSIVSSNFLRPILNKENGIVKKGALVSHISIFSIPTYHKFLILSDVAVNISPDLSDKVKITKNAIELAKNLDIAKPKVAFIAAAESVNLKMQSSIDASILSKMGDRKVFGDALVEGPMAIDLAVSKESCEEKKFVSPVCGDADILILDDINTGNAIYKTLAKLAKADLGAILYGTSAPVILTSRGDTAQVKYDSLLLAVMMLKKEEK